MLRRKDQGILGTILLILWFIFADVGGIPGVIAQWVKWFPWLKDVRFPEMNTDILLGAGIALVLTGTVPGIHWKGLYRRIRFGAPKDPSKLHFYLDHQKAVRAYPDGSGMLYGHVENRNDDVTIEKVRVMVDDIQPHDPISPFRLAFAVTDVENLSKEGHGYDLHPGEIQPVIVAERRGNFFYIGLSGDSLFITIGLEGNGPYIIHLVSYGRGVQQSELYVKLFVDENGQPQMGEG